MPIGWQIGLAVVTAVGWLVLGLILALVALGVLGAFAALLRSGELSREEERREWQRLPRLPVPESEPIEPMERRE